MITTIIFLAMLILGIALGIVYSKTYYYDSFFCLSIILCTFGIIGTIVCTTVIVRANIGVSVEICNVKEKQTSIQKQIDIVNSEYEDISKTEVIQRATKWNVKVNSRRYWSKNIFTNWFYNKDVVNAYEYIKIE